MYPADVQNTLLHHIFVYTHFLHYVYDGDLYAQDMRTMYPTDVIKVNTFLQVNIKGKHGRTALYLAAEGK